MFNSPKSTLALLLTATVVLFTQSAWAQGSKTSVALLSVESSGSIPAKVAATYARALESLISKDSRGLAPLSTAKTKGLLMDQNPALAGCITEKCLVRVGQSTGLTVGVVASASGEAQIYDFEVAFYDLTTGKTATKERGSCEICTDDEALKSFNDTASRALKKLVLPKAPEKVVAPTPKKPEVKKPAKKEVLTTVDIVVMPQSADLLLGDLPLGSGTATRTLKSGKYTIRAKAEGYEDLESELMITEKPSGPIMLRLQMAKTHAAPALEEAGEKSPQVVETYGLHKPGLGWTMLILGSGAAAGGAYLLTIDGKTTCAEGDINECPNVFETTAGGTGLLSAGALSAGVGLVLVILDIVTPTEADLQSEDGGKIGLEVDPEAGGAFIQWGTTF
jgi:hypothetical protein